MYVFDQATSDVLNKNGRPHFHEYSADTLGDIQLVTVMLSGNMSYSRSGLIGKNAKFLKISLHFSLPLAF